MYKHEYGYFQGMAGHHFNFYQLPEDLVLREEFRELSSDAKLLYSVMLKRVGLSFRNGWIDDKGRTYIIYTLEEVMKVFHCANQKATKLFNELELYGLIEKTRQGQGKPVLIYVKDIASPVDCVDNPHQTNEDSHVKTHENHDSGTMIIRNQDSWKSGASNKDKSYIKCSKRDPILSGWDEDGMEEHRRLTEYFKESLEYDILLLDHPHDRETLEGILTLLVDTCCSKRAEIRIAGDDRPKNVVKSQLMKLNFSHIQYVLGCLKDNTSDVKNIKQYLLTALYNAVTTIDPYFPAKVNHDFYGAPAPKRTYGARRSPFEDYSYAGTDSF